MSLYTRPGSANFWCRFQISGTEIKRSTGTTSRRAAEVEERRLRAYYESKAPARPRRGTRTLADMGGLDVARAKANGVTEEHQAILEIQWGHIVKHLGADSELRSLTAETIREYISARRDEKAKGQTICREVAALKRACTMAHERGWLAFMPEHWPQIKRDPPGEKGGKFHSPEVIKKWLRKLPQDARDSAEVAMLTSLRAAELRRVCSTWLRMAPNGSGIAQMLHVPDGSSKSRKSKTIPLSPRAYKILKRRAKGVPNDVPLLPGNHKRAFATARKAIDYGSTISLRDLRHTWATLAAATIGVDAARPVLGHSSLTTTSRYVHDGLGRGAQAVRAIEALIGTGKSAHARKRARLVGAAGLELATPSSQSLAVEDLEHFTNCVPCREHARRARKMRVIEGQVGTYRPAQSPRAKGGVAS